MGELNRRDFMRLAGAGAGALALAGLAGWSRAEEGPAAVAAAAAGQRMNVLLVLSDDQRWDMLGAAGNKVIHTPHLDRLAQEGVHFQECVTAISLCIPSRASLLTGLPANKHGFYGNAQLRKALPFDQIPTLAGTLKNAGYHTVMAGKWHSLPVPWTMGFTDVRSWLPKGSTVYLDPELCEGQSTDKKPRKGYTNELFAEDIAAFLKSKEAAERPFFAYLALTAPHGPSAPNRAHLVKPYLGRTDKELAPPGLPQDAMEIKAGDWPEYYSAACTADEGLGRALMALDDAKLADNTVVIFLSDNGYMMGSRGLHGKVVPYEESIRVPLLVRWPGRRGFTGPSTAQVSSLDVSATILAAAGVRPPADWPGRDLRPALQDRAAPGFEVSFADYCDNDIEGRAQFRMARTRTHKLIRWERQDLADEFYNLAQDPHETKNLIDSPAEAKALAELTRQLEANMERTGDYARGWPREKKPAGR